MLNVVLLGFGGPATQEDVRPFVDRVLRGRNVSRERSDLIVSHYEHIGGKSPFNERTQAQATLLLHELHQRGVDAGVRTAYLHCAPFASEVADALRRDGPAQTIVIILAAHRSAVSWDKYIGVIPDATYAPQYYDHPLFIEANALRIREALVPLNRSSFDDVEVVFTAHSIPQAAANMGPYAYQMARSSALIATSLGCPAWRIAYQSRSVGPAETWLGPDIRDTITALPQQGRLEAIVAPIGFLCDNAEVLYDLDVDAAAVARQAGLRMERAATLNDHPLFIHMLADLVQQCSV